MPKAIDPKVWDKVRSTYFANPTETYESLTRFGVSVRAIKAKSKEEGDWKRRRDTEAIATRAIASEVSVELAKPIPSKSVRVAMQGIDRKQVFETAIASLHAAAPDAEIKSQEAAYGQLVKIMQAEQQMQHQERMADVEYRLKETDLLIKQRQLNPPTLKEWLEYALVTFGFSPSDLIDGILELAKNR